MHARCASSLVFFCFSISRGSVSRVNLTIACVADLSLSRVKCISDGISLSRVVVVLCTGALGGVFPWGTGGRSSRVCHLFLVCVRVASTRIKSLVSAGHGQQGNTLRQARNTLVVRNKGIEWPPAKRLCSICSKREKRNRWATLGHVAVASFSRSIGLALARRAIKEGLFSQTEGAMISHFRLASSQSTGEALPSTKTFLGSSQALLSCVQSCPGWCEDTGPGGVRSAVSRQLA